MSFTRQALSNERGSVLALIAITMFLFLGLAALAIDLGMVKTSAAQAQRAADAAALAGASAFVDYVPSDPQASDSARARAYAYATRQSIRTAAIDSSSEVTVTVVPDSQKVRVRIARANMPTWFANTFGISSISVSRTAAAVASPVGISNSCIKPFFIPDLWRESEQDANHNGAIDGTPTEEWYYEPNKFVDPTKNDSYKAWDPANPTDPNATGYGSGRNGIAGDRGLTILLKPQTGNSPRAGNFYFTLDGPEHNLQQDITSGCIAGSVGQEPVYASGGATGQARHGVDDLVKDDKDAYWDTNSKTVMKSKFSDWTQSPRVVVVGLFDPKFIEPTCTAAAQGNAQNCKPAQGATYANFARIFLTATQGNDDIQATFIGFVGGGGGAGTTGPLVKALRLVE